MKIVAFGASNSSRSINKKFAVFTTSFFLGADVSVLDLNDYELPIYSSDREKEFGIPDKAILFCDQLQSADLLIISLAEHNGSYTAAFKNIFDWVSRHNGKCFENKNLFLLSTSPGQRGGKGVMDTALVRFPIHGAEILEYFSLPKFGENFNAELGIIEEELKESFHTKVRKIKSHYGMEDH
ncbi:MAG: NAD(P)H-dependent oxidoreductase [Saprospiraceae bacterium]|nr:NAD(P)H-dependent oxidoreductase [Saprospiraceae bacterium]